MKSQQPNRRDERRISSTKRGYGSRWQRARKAYLFAHPLCALCQQDGKLTPATVVDHRIPHKGDQAKFWTEDNWQALCAPHHNREKQRQEYAWRRTMDTHPDWLPAPACPVILVTGPPGAGKSTYCQHSATPDDVVIDLDECFRTVSGTHGHTASRQYLGEAINLRNQQLADLSTRTQGRAFFIVSAPATAEVDWWMHTLHADHVRIDPGLDVCQRRVARHRVPAVVDWYMRARQDHWVQPKPERPSPTYQKVGADGWPIEA